MTAKQDTRKKILITGGTSGLGSELTRKLVSGGCEVWITGRTLKQNDIPANTFHFLRTDFADLKDVADTISGVLDSGLQFDAVINNAGVLGHPSCILTGDGFEYTFQVNFLAHLMTSLMIAGAADSDHQIIFVNVTSPVYRLVKPGFRVRVNSDYRSFRAYSESKYYLLLLPKALSDSFPEKKISSFCFDPGIFNSGIYRTQARWFHGLYKIGSPILRDPGIVAGNLIEVLHSGSFIPGMVYKSLRRSNPFPWNGSSGECLFLNECKKMLDPYLPPRK